MKFQHGSLNNSVDTMGDVLAGYFRYLILRIWFPSQMLVNIRSREDIAELRMSLHAIKEVLSNKRGSQANLHELWLRKKLLQEQLRLVDEIHVLRDSPLKIEALMRQKCFVAAVNLFNQCMKTMFGEV